MKKLYVVPVLLLLCSLTYIVTLPMHMIAVALVLAGKGLSRVREEMDEEILYYMSKVSGLEIPKRQPPA